MRTKNARITVELGCPFSDYFCLKGSPLFDRDSGIHLSLYEQGKVLYRWKETVFLVKNYSGKFVLLQSCGSPLFYRSFNIRSSTQKYVLSSLQFYTLSALRCILAKTVFMMRVACLLIITLTLAAQGGAQAPRHFESATESEYARKMQGNLARMDSLQQKINEHRSRQELSALLTALRLYHFYCEETGRYGLFAVSAREMLPLAETQRNKFMEAIALVNLGRVMAGRDQYDSASYYQFKALKIAEVLGNDSLQAEASTSLGGIFNFRKDYQRNLEFAGRALEHAEKWGRSLQLTVLCMGNKALALSWVKRYREAIALEQQALPLAEKLGTYDYINIIKMNLASNWVALKDHEQAEKILGELTKELPAHSTAPLYRVSNLAIVGMIYWDMRDGEKATSLLLAQIPAAKEIKENHLLQRIYDTLSVITESEGRYKDALAYKKASQQYQSLLQKETNDRMFSELEVKYQSAEKEKALSRKSLQLAQKDLQLQKNRYYMYYALAALVVCLLIVTLLVIQYRHRRRLHQNEMKTLQQQRELQLLQALMQGEEKERSRIAKDLHDGVAGMLAAVKMHFSSIPTASELNEAEGYRQGMRLLNEATHEIRKTSHNLMPEVLLQHGLDEALRRYCNSINNSKAVQIEYDSWGEIDRFTDSFELSVYRIVQELVNNIIKHSRATEAMVQLTQQNDLLSISIEDNGVGFSSENSAEGMGLRSLQSRIKAMNGKMEMQASAKTGVSAYLEFEIADLKKEMTAAL